MNADMLLIASSAIYLRKRPLTMAIFDVIADDPGIAGYGIARALDQNPELVRQLISALLKMGLISGVPDLRDNFTLTAAGFGVRMCLLTFVRAPLQS